MQMLVFPAHCRLKNIMQIGDAAGARNAQSAPNRWADEMTLLEQQMTSGLGHDDYLE